MIHILESLNDDGKAGGKYCLVQDDHLNILTDPGSQESVYLTEKKETAETYKRLLKKDFNVSSTVMTVKDALIVLSNKQAEITIHWEQAMRDFRQQKTMEDKYEWWDKHRPKLGPHPICYHQEIMNLLGVSVTNIT